MYLLFNGWMPPLGWSRRVRSSLGEMNGRLEIFMLFLFYKLLGLEEAAYSSNPLARQANYTLDISKESE